MRARERSVRERRARWRRRRQAMAAMKVKKALEEREGVQRCNCLMTDFFPEKFNKL